MGNFASNNTKKKFTDIILVQYNRIDTLRTKNIIKIDDFQQQKLGQEIENPFFWLLPFVCSYLFMRFHIKS